MNNETPKLGSGLISPVDFNPVAQLVSNTDLQKLSIAVSEAEEFDLKPLTSPAIWTKLKNLILFIDNHYIKHGIVNGEDPGYNAVIGGKYQCLGQQYEHLGLKRIIVYYSYSRYLLINEFNDTPNGNVSKTNNFSLPKPLKEVKDFANKYRTMGLHSWNYLHQFLCLNKNFLNLQHLDCKPCNCPQTTNNNSIAKGLGIRSKHIHKNQHNR